MAEQMSTPSAAVAGAGPAPDVPAVAAAPIDAIIFIPGIGGGSEMGPDQSIDGVSRRLASALDINAKTAANRFTVAFREEPYGNENAWTSRIARLARVKGRVESPVADVFYLNYGETLVGKYRNSNLLVRALIAFWVTFQAFALLAHSAFRGKGKGTFAKAQLWYGAGILSLISAYALVLVLTVVGIAVQAAATSRTAPPSRPSTPPQTQPAGEGEPVERSWIVKWFGNDTVKTAVIVLAALGVVVPRDWKKSLENVAVDFLCAMQYVRLGQSKQEMILQTASLIDRIREREAGGDSGVTYERVIVIAYSFGGILAIDTLVPFESSILTRAKEVNKLVTIGCPFDLLRTFWPTYFNGRSRLEGVDWSWLNVYAAEDIFGSNFKDGTDKEVAPEVGVKLGGEPGRAGGQVMPTKNVAYRTGNGQRAGSRLEDLIDFFCLSGLHAHGQYWGRGEALEVNCFSEVVRELYDGDDDALS